MRHYGLKIAILALLTVAAYVPAVRAPAVFDDELLFASPIIQGKEPISIFHDARALQHLLARVIYHFAGANPTPFHLFGLSLHLINGLLVFFVARRIFLLAGDTALLVLGLFWLHPFQSQAVIYIVQQCEALCLFGILVSFIGFTSTRHLLTVIGAIVALMSKEISLMLPLLFLLWLFHTGTLAQHRRKLLWMALATSLAFALPVVSNALPSVLINASPKHIPEVLFLASKFVLPLGLSIDHDLRFLVPWTMGALMLASVLALLALTYRQTIYGFGLMWFGIFMLPHVLGEPAGYLAEHHFYTPSVGICLLLAALISKLGSIHVHTPISTANVECH